MATTELSPDILIRLLAGVILILASGFFVGSEFALTRVRQFDPDVFTDTPGLERAWEMTKRLEIYLSSCQVGITITSIGLGVVTEPALTKLLGPVIDGLGLGAASGHALSALLAVVVLNLLYLVFGEQVPTYLGIERTRTVAHYFAPLLYWWARVMYPVIRLADMVSKLLLSFVGVPITRSWTEDESTEADILTISGLRDEIARVLSRGMLSEERIEEIMNALGIQETPVSEIMVPREEITALSTKDDIEAIIERLQEDAHDRFPLIGDSLTEFEGIVYAPALLSKLDTEDAAEMTLRDLASPPMTVSATTSVSDLIDQFQTQNQELALVMEGGEIVGLVTATDAFEAIAGDIQDPIDIGFTRGSPYPPESNER